MKKMTDKSKKIKIQKTYLSIKIQVFFLVLLVIACVGLLLPLRPKESALEKRELEKFPQISAASLLDGSFFNQISTWYADTFPFREALLSANSGMKNMYGIQGEQIVANSGKTGDDIPEGGMMVTKTEETAPTRLRRQKPRRKHFPTARSTPFPRPPALSMLPAIRRLKSIISIWTAPTHILI